MYVTLWTEYIRDVNLLGGKSSKRTGQHLTATVGFSGPGSCSTGLDGGRQDKMVDWVKQFKSNRQNLLCEIVSHEDVGTVPDLLPHLIPASCTGKH